jgi:uncharacterized membrane protein
MESVPAIGATCLGMVVGWLVRYFIRRFDKFNAQVLGSIVSILAGGAVVRFLEADRTVWWFYPIGLFLGFVLYTAVAVLFAKKYPVDGVIFSRGPSANAGGKNGEEK